MYYSLCILGHAEKIFLTEQCVAYNHQFLALHIVIETRERSRFTEPEDQLDTGHISFHSINTVYVINSMRVQYNKAMQYVAMP